ncbi:MAG: sigma 54-interacting transcriptional regulator [Phycisphaeraceae bacterium]|nr:sigma 54-interacting transcriptional regulator [Phycisphaeraceae bacterium]
MAANPRILIVDDDPLVAESLAEFLAREGYSTATAGDGQEALALLDALATPGNSPAPGSAPGNAPAAGSAPGSAGGYAPANISPDEPRTSVSGHSSPAPAGAQAKTSKKSKAVAGTLRAAEPQSPSSAGVFGVIITDVNMPRCGGMDLLKALRKKHESIVPIVITGYGKIESAVEAVKLGAVDYLTKPIVDDELRIAVSKAVRQHSLLDENRHLRSQLAQRFGLENLVGADYRMQKVYDLVEAVASSKTTVLIEGESGTGKTMIAHAIHARSPRSAGPFVTFSCGAIPETLLESELFGHVKGAFTGADTDKPGKILAAEGGTLFIDEINSATPALQLKLLRVLQERCFEPVGSTRTLSADVRFVLATNQSLRDLVTAGSFREDLFYRINVVNIHLPPLRDRLGDIPLLAEHFLAKYCRETSKTITHLTEDALQALARYAWPGNVRELENAVERAVVLSRRPVLGVEDLPDSIVCPQAGPRSALTLSAADAHAGGMNVRCPALENGWTAMPLVEALIEPEKQIILAALKANGWNRQETARQLNINRTTLYKKIKQFNLDTPEGFAA